MKNGTLYYNRYPQSAYADAKGLKRLAVNSRSLSFNEELFNKNAWYYVFYEVKYFQDEKQANEYARKLSKISRIPFLGFIHFIDIGNRESSKGEGIFVSNDYNVVVAKKGICKIRDNSREHFRLIFESFSGECLICGAKHNEIKPIYKDYKVVGFPILSVLLEDGFSRRSEFICEDCIKEHNLDMLGCSTYKRMDDFLQTIKQIMLVIDNKRS